MHGTLTRRCAKGPRRRVCAAPRKRDRVHGAGVACRDPDQPLGIVGAVDDLVERRHIGGLDGMRQLDEVSFE